MILSIASDTRIDAGLAEIEITVLADAAMVMLIGHRLAAVVAVDTIGVHGEVVEGRKRRQTEEISVAVSRALEQGVRARSVEVEGAGDGTRRIWASLLQTLA